MKFKATDRIYYGALALAEMTPMQWAAARQTFRDNMLESTARVLEGVRIFDKMSSVEPAVIWPSETPHVTDGSPCWCHPEVIHVSGKNGP